MKMQKSLSKKDAKGFSLIELLLVIGFIAGALVLAFITYPKVQATSRANTTSQQLTLISAGIKNLYATARNYSSLTVTVLNDAKLLPEDMAINGDELSNVWGGTLLIAPVNNNRHYTLTLSSVPPAECVKIATGVGINFLKLAINSTDIFDRTVQTDQVNVDPAVVTGACSQEANDMILTGN